MVSALPWLATLSERKLATRALGICDVRTSAIRNVVRQIAWEVSDMRGDTKIAVGVFLFLMAVVTVAPADALAEGGVNMVFHVEGMT